MGARRLSSGSEFRKQQQERELNMQRLRARMDTKANLYGPVDLTSDSEDHKIAAVKTEPGDGQQQNRWRNRGSANAPIPARSRSFSSDQRFLYNTEHDRRTIGARESAETSNLARKASARAPEGGIYAEFSGPYPEQFPTIIHDPNGTPGIDFVELRCYKCGANWGRSNSFFKGVYGLRMHMIWYHGDEFARAREEVPSPAGIVEACAHRNVSLEELESLWRKESLLDVVPAVGTGQKRAPPKVESVSKKRKRAKLSAAQRNTRKTLPATESVDAEARDRVPETSLNSHRKLRPRKQKRDILESSPKASGDEKSDRSGSATVAQRQSTPADNAFRCRRASPPHKASKRSSEGEDNHMEDLAQSAQPHLQGIADYILDNFEE